MTGSIIALLAIGVIVLLAIASALLVRCPRCGSPDVDDAAWPRTCRCRHCGNVFRT